jgi:hypothetical protein
VLAGWIESVLAGNIPEWAGNKLDPVQPGVITIVLSLVSLICVNCLHGHRHGLTRGRALAGLLILATAGICFITVGRRWYVPGRLLLASSALRLRR